MNYNICDTVKHELRVTSSKLKSTSWKSKVPVWIHELRVQLHKRQAFDCSSGSGNIKQEIITRDWTYKLPYESLSCLSNSGLMIFGNEFYLAALKDSLLEYSMILDSWTRNSWIWSRIKSLPLPRPVLDI